MTTEDTKRLSAKVFAILDPDGNGKISRGQLVRAIRLIGFNPTDDQVQEWLKAVQSPELNYTQFQEFVEDKLRQQSTYERQLDLRSALSTFDTMSTGSIDKEILLGILTNYGAMRFDAEDVRPYIERLDIRRDGRIRIAELEDLLTADEDVEEMLNEMKWEKL